LSGELQTQVSATNSLMPLTPARTGLLQRKCECGGSPGIAGECAECQGKRLTLQRSSLDRAAPASLLQSPFAAGGSKVTSGRALRYSFDHVRVHNHALPAVQPKLPMGELGEQHEQEADPAAQQVLGSSEPGVGRLRLPRLSVATPFVQRMPADEQVASPAPPAAAATSETEAAPAGLLAEDEAGELGPGQMRKTEFLDELQRAVCAAADAELAAVGRTAQGCPYIERWIGYYRTRSSSQVERALRRYAPEATAVRTAGEYIPAVAERVRRAVSVWATTGQLTGVPEELAGQLFGGGSLGAVSGLLGGVGSVLSGIFTKAREGGARHADDPQRIQAQLGSGNSLDGGVRAKMETAFGHDFSRVRVHTDSQAARLSDNLNARAFTVGTDVAFAAGEYHPGTLVGDALLAHELAHVVQQGGSVSPAGPLPKSETEYNSLEEDADISAVGAVISLWGRAKGATASISQNTTSRLKSGLRLQRCKKDTCSAGDRTVTVDIIKLKDVTRSPATDLAEANKIFKKCCVQFVVGQEPPVTDTDSNKWLGNDTDLQVSDTSCTDVPAEQKATFDGAASKYKLASRLKIFYVATFSGADAYAITCDAGHYVNHTVIQNDALSDTLAHELGHHLLDNDEHHGIDNPSDTKNLMFAPGRTASELDDSQCKIIYNNI